MRSASGGSRYGAIVQQEQRVSHGANNSNSAPTKRPYPVYEIYRVFLS